MPCARGVTACPSSARNRTGSSSRVITKATPVSRAGHTAPIIQADWWPLGQALAPDFIPLGFRMSPRDFRQAARKPPFLKAC
jgi:hypothetical protein